MSEMPKTPEELQLVAVLIAISFNHVTYLRSISLLLHAADIWVSITSEMRTEKRWLTDIRTANYLDWH